MPDTASGAHTLANTLLTSLTTGLNFSVPAVDLSDLMFQQPPSTGELFDEIDDIEITDLTTGVVGGTGAFDKIMSSLVAHLQEEYKANRISGAEYTKAYQAMVAQALQTATQFLLTKDTAYWQALLVQKQAQAAAAAAVQARVELEIARIGAVRAQFEAKTTEVNYALTKLKLATEDQTIENLAKQGEGLDFTNDFILPKQRDLLTEQVEVQRAQTLNTRTDGATVVGVLGKQKDLYTQQITSYQRDAETKFVKLFSDAWITQKTIDEGLLAPTQFTNSEVDAILLKLRTNLSLTA